MNEVQDKKAEQGINVSNVIQTLLLASTIGFGTMITSAVNNLSEEVGRLTTNTSLNTNNISRNIKDIVRLDIDVQHLNTKVDNHILECKKKE